MNFNFRLHFISKHEDFHYEQDMEKIRINSCSPLDLSVITCTGHLQTGSCKNSGAEYTGKARNIKFSLLLFIFPAAGCFNLNWTHTTLLMSIYNFFKVVEYCSKQKTKNFQYPVKRDIDQ